MEIKVEKKSEDPLNDILDTILNLDNINFKKATRTINWEFDEGLNFYYSHFFIYVFLNSINYYFFTYFHLSF